MSQLFDAFDHSIIPICGVFQGSVLELLLFLVHVKGQPNASCLLGKIMFADDANLFFNHKDIKHLFKVIKRS